jgi:hypothetical protein
VKRGSLIAVFLPACLLVSGYLLAGSGYREQYDFADQGDDWYGSVTSPNPRFDFPQYFIETFSDGEDFGLGYMLEIDLFGFGPPLDATNTSLFEYFFRHGALEVVPWSDGGGGTCVYSSDCWDSDFCDGLEVCLFGRCAAGSPPACGDGDPCTLDYCSAQTDACAHDPITEPGEVGGLLLARSGSVASIAVLTWYAQPPSDDYNVYRGQFSDLGGLACYQADIIGTTLDDDGTVAASGLFVYLVTGYGCGGESTLGYDFGYQERINNSPCP